MTIQELYTVLGFKVDTTGIESAKSAVTSFKRFLGGLGIGYIMYQGARVALETAAAYQSSEAQFTTLLKSQTKAQDLMKDLFQYAKESTFEMEHVTKAQDILMSYGMASDKAFQSMKMLGDVAGADSHAFNRLALATAQVFGKTRLMGEEMRQLLNARGGLIAKQVSDMFFGGDRAKMEAAQRAKKVSFEMFYQALQALTSRGGTLFENQKNQMNTLLGRWTSMKDNIKNVGREMVMAMEVPIKGVMELIQNTDFTPFINMAKLVGFSIEYLAQVIWQTGLKESWEEFKKDMSALGYEFGITSEKMGGFGGTLYVIGTLIRSAIQVVLRLVVWVAKAAEMAYEFWGMLMRWREVLPVVAVGLGLLAGHLLSVWMQMKNLMFIFDGSLLRLMYIWDAIKGTRAALATWGAASMINPIMLAAAALGAVAFAIYRINDALQEKRDLEAMIDGEEKKADLMAKTLTAQTVYRDALKSGDQRDIDRTDRIFVSNIKQLEDAGAGKAAAAFWRRKAALTDGTWGKKSGGGAPSTPEELAAQAVADPQGFIDRIKAQTAGDTKTQNVTINSEFNVTTPGSADGKTGLTAQEVADLASCAARSVFSMEVLRLSEGMF